jgi:dihydrofolate synthase/folylpolyglutamate synthase
MSYAAAIDRLSAMTPELFTQPGQPRRKYSLDEIGVLLAALGDPNRRYRAVLIAGTNGKGSTAATLASILTASGLRAGLYTSPHLTRPNERIRVNGVEITDDAFAALYFRVDDRGRNLVAEGRLGQLPSFFETLTAMAFLHFAEASIDIAVLEAGMGGRLDATNIVEPILSVVTDISLDHTEWLGPTIAAIAREKAGILRPNGTLITLPQHPEANQVLGEIATQLGVRAISAVPYMPQMPPLSAAGEEGNGLKPGHSKASISSAFLVAAEKLGVSGEPDERGRSAAEARIDSIDLVRGLKPPPPSESSSSTACLAAEEISYRVEALGKAIEVASPLHGAHQHRNISLAIAAAVELATRHGLPITAASLEEGIRNTRWPGRFEIIEIHSSKESARPQMAHVVLDVAHNPAGAWALRAALRSFLGLNAPDVKAAVLLFGCLRDKPVAEMAQILFPIFDRVIFAPIHSPRATPMADLLAAAASTGTPAAAATSVAEALELAETSASAANRSAGGAGTVRRAVVVIAGSVYLVGEARALLLTRDHTCARAGVPA